jgi:hypothetical protein
MMILTLAASNATIIPGVRASVSAAIATGRRGSELEFFCHEDYRNRVACFPPVGAESMLPVIKVGNPPAHQATCFGPLGQKHATPPSVA